MPFAGRVSLTRRPGAYLLANVFGLDFYVSGDGYASFAGDVVSFHWMAKPASSVHATVELERTSVRYALNVESLEMQELKLEAVAAQDSPSMYHVCLNIPTLTPAAGQIGNNNVEIIVHLDPTERKEATQRRDCGDEPAIDVRVGPRSQGHVGSP